MQVKEIMTSPAITVGPNQFVREIVDLMLKNQIHGIPVVDEEERLLGMVLLDDLVKRETRPTHFLSLLSSEDAFEVMKQYQDECRRVAGITASEIMRTEHPIATLDDPTPKVAGIMVNEDISTLPVVEEGKVIGVVSEFDILKTMAKYQQ